MDIDKFRARWEDPEFVKSYAQLVQEPVSEIIRRMKRRERREKQWRIARQVIMRTPLLVLLGLAAFRIYVKDSQETLLQTIAFMLELAVFFGLTLLDKARQKYEHPKMWLADKEFLPDEHRRTVQNIHFDLWTSVLLDIAIACAGLYAAPFLSADLQLACLAVTAAIIIVLQVYYLRRISHLRRTRDDLAAQLDDLLRD